MELKANSCAGSQHSCVTEYKELYANKPARNGSPLYQEYHKERYSRQHCFLLYIQDLPARLKSTVKLFADDTKIYRTISSEDDAAKLQHDLNMLAAWSDTWHMNFNKCAVVPVKRGSNYVYTLNGKELASVKQQKDLGLLVSSNLMPRNHIETICSKVNRKTGMTKRCFMNKSQQ